GVRKDLQATDGFALPQQPRVSVTVAQGSKLSTGSSQRGGTSSLQALLRAARVPVYAPLTSTIIASPCPPPEQIAATPRPPPRRRSSWTSVVRMRAPLAPIGCPSAIAPPFTLTLASSTPSIRIELSATEANASLISNSSMSS